MSILDWYFTCSCCRLNMKSMVPLPGMKPNCIPSMVAMLLTSFSTILSRTNHLASQEISEGRGTDLRCIFESIFNNHHAFRVLVSLCQGWTWLLAVRSCRLQSSLSSALSMLKWQVRSSSVMALSEDFLGLPFPLLTSWVYLSLFLHLPLVIGTSLSRSHFCLHDQPTCTGCISACRPFLNLHAADPA